MEEEEGAEGEEEEAEGTTHAISSNRATAPEVATAASPMRGVEVEVPPVVVVTINPVREQTYFLSETSFFNDSFS